MSARYDLIESMWREGASMDEIAERLGSTKASVGVSMQRMRARGCQLPYRKVPLNPAYPDQAPYEKPGFRICGHCGELKPEIAFPFPLRTRCCFECAAERSRNFDQDRTANSRRTRSRRPDRSRARQRVQEAVKTGRLVKPHACERCGFIPKRVSEIHGHHADYSRPLDVEWLCERCHRAEHIRLKFTEKEKSAASCGSAALNTSKESTHARIEAQ